MRKNLWLIFLCLLALSQSYAQRTIYVSQGGANNPPYTNWPSAATSIQAAINVATNGEVVQLSNDVYVSTGIYSSNSFLFITNGITLRGFSAQSPTNTVIDGGYPGVINGCIYMNNANARLEHIWVRNGYTTVSNLPSFTAGGVRMEYGTMSNCWVSECTNMSYGAGGVYMGNGLITHSVISNNVNMRPTAYTNASNLTGPDYYNLIQAGGVLMSGLGNIYNSRIVTNRVGNMLVVGGVGMTGSGGTFSNCHISFNFTPNRGAGIYCNGTITKLYNCTFFGNRSPGGVAGAIGGGVATVEYCSFVSNLSLRGGALDLGGTLTMRNTLISANTSTALQGGGISTGNGLTQMTLESCTIVANSVGGVGGGVSLTAPNSVFRNCIIYGNTATTAGSDDLYQNTSPSDASLSNTVEYCCIRSNLTKAVALVTNNPNLVNMAGGGDSHLNVDSPCINTGSNQSWMATAKDLDGNPRLDRINNRVDIGAYEFVFRGLIFQGR